MSAIPPHSQWWTGGSLNSQRWKLWKFLHSSLAGIKNSLRAHAISTTQGNLASPRCIVKMEDQPDHLLVLVHGILGSPSDWTYFEAELKMRLGKKFLIYASSCNMYTKTFTGIDGAAKRLADEVTLIVKKTENLKRISFLAHSLGGLFARYAIGVLCSPSAASDQSYDTGGCTAKDFKTLHGSNKASILGVPFLEKLAVPIAPVFAGRTGSQLFLTDGKPKKPPLLLQMTSDCEDGKFLSALGAFRCQVLYANVSFDQMVGWRTSSIRREIELLKPPSRSLDGYKHVVSVEYCPPVLSDVPKFPPEAAKEKEAAQNEPSTQNTVEYHEFMEEEIIHGLQRIGWWKVDVSFHSAFWPSFAHNNIHVKNHWFHNAGAGVVAHVADTINRQEKQQDVSTCIAACL